mgnify:CR=1 FL=1
MHARAQLFYVFLILYFAGFLIFFLEGFEVWLVFSLSYILHFLLLFLLVQGLGLWNQTLYGFMSVTMLLFYYFARSLDVFTEFLNCVVLGPPALAMYATLLYLLFYDKIAWTYFLRGFGLGVAMLSALCFVKPSFYALLSVFFALLFSAGYVSRFGRVPLRVYGAAAASAAAALTAPDEAAVIATAAPYVALAVPQLLTRRGEVGSTPQKTPASSSLAYGVV